MSFLFTVCRLPGSCFFRLRVRPFPGGHTSRAVCSQRLGGDSGMDVLSLVLSLGDEHDDRVQIEIDRLLEEFKW